MDSSVAAAVVVGVLVYMAVMLYSLRVKQGIKIYCFYAILHLLLLYVEFFAHPGTDADAAEGGMVRGSYHTFYVGLQLLIGLIMLGTFTYRQVKAAR